MVVGHSTFRRVPAVPAGIPHLKFANVRLYGVWWDDCRFSSVKSRDIIMPFAGRMGFGCCLGVIEYTGVCLKECFFFSYKVLILHVLNICVQIIGV